MDDLILVVVAVVALVAGAAIIAVVLALSMTIRDMDAFPPEREVSPTVADPGTPPCCREQVWQGVAHYTCDPVLREVER